LNTVVGVDDGAQRWSAVLDRHVQGIDDKVCALIFIEGPADDLSTEGILDGAANEHARFCACS
jgi:hypothetical protein